MTVHPFAPDQSAGPLPFGHAASLGDQLRAHAAARLLVTHHLAFFHVHGRQVEQTQANATLEHPTTGSLTMAVLLRYLSELLVGESAIACADLRPAPLTRSAHAVVCPCCYSKTEVRSMVRYAGFPSQFQTRLYLGDPRRWAVVAAALVAVVLSHRTDPLAALRELDGASGS